MSRTIFGQDLVPGLQTGMPMLNALELILKELKSLNREIEVLRQYGNKDCTAQADEILAKEAPSEVVQAPQA